MHTACKECKHRVMLYRGNSYTKPCLVECPFDIEYPLWNYTVPTKKEILDTLDTIDKCECEPDQGGPCSFCMEAVHGL